MKTYNYKGKTVVAVPEIKGCYGCVFLDEWDGCVMYTDNSPRSYNQRKHNMSDCFSNKIRFKLATDETNS